MSRAWRETGGAPVELEEARQRWLRETEYPDRPGEHDFSGWPEGLLKYHVDRRMEERSWLKKAAARAARRKRKTRA